VRSIARSVLSHEFRTGLDREMPRPLPRGWKKTQPIPIRPAAGSPFGTSFFPTGKTRPKRRRAVLERPADQEDRREAALLRSDNLFLSSAPINSCLMVVSDPGTRFKGPCLSDENAPAGAQRTCNGTSPRRRRCWANVFLNPGCREPGDPTANTRKQKSTCLIDGKGKVRAGVANHVSRDRFPGDRGPRVRVPSYSGLDGVSPYPAVHPLTMRAGGRPTVIMKD